MQCKEALAAQGETPVSMRSKYVCIFATMRTKNPQEREEVFLHRVKFVSVCCHYMRPFCKTKYEGPTNR